MRDKDAILLENAYKKVLNETIRGREPFGSRGEEPDSHDRAGMGADFDEHEASERWTEPDIDPHVELGNKILDRLEHLGAFKYGYPKHGKGLDINGKEYWEYYSDPIITKYINEYRPYYIDKILYNPTRSERIELEDNYDIFNHAIGSAWEHEDRKRMSQDYSEEE